MINNDEFEKFILRAVDFIEGVQNEDGSFNSYSSNSKELKNPEIFITTFYSSLILSLLSEVESPKLLVTKKKLADFLLKEKSSIDSFNYWAKNFSKYKDEPCPDDLDDTACAWSAIHKYDSKLVDVNVLSNITKLLVSLEESEGGPYNTWVLPQVKKTKWANVDLAVNANTGYFLSLLDVSLPSIEIMTEKAIASNRFESLYYPEDSVLFFVSRFYRGKLKDDLVHNSLQKNKNDHPLNSALIGLSLLNLGFNPQSIEKNIHFILSCQKENGSLGSGVFINERTFTNCKRYSGCDALTAALGLVFVSQYRGLVGASSQTELSCTQKEQIILKKKVIKHTKQIFRERFSEDLNTVSERYINKICKADPDNQIALHPFLFLQSIDDKSLSLDKNFLLNLCSGSILGWVSYTIFDNIADENKDLDKLSFAILCNRELEKLFCKDNGGFENIFHSIMDRVDYANFYEAQNAKLDRYLESGHKIYRTPEFVAEKSIAHAAGPLSLLFKIGYNEKTDEFKNLLLFYINYLTARQLNDDAHDWSEDLKRGQVNYVGERVLEYFLANCNKKFNFTNDLPSLQKVFWHKIILEICQIIQDKVLGARDCLDKIDFVDNSFLYVKLCELEASTQKALTEREKTIQYIDNLFSASKKL